MRVSANNYIELKQVGHGFGRDENAITLFEKVNITIQKGKSYAITGPSGSGKSSLLMLLAGLEKPKQGKFVAYLDNKQETEIKLRKQIGFIFQQFHLLPELSALANVALPLRLRGTKRADYEAQKWLAKVGLSHRINHKPSQLSGGEQQRVAIARALVFNPSFIFADEPTGNLDNNNASDVADLLFSCCSELGAGLITVTHCDELGKRAQERFSLRNGKCHVC